MNPRRPLRARYTLGRFGMVIVAHFLLGCSSPLREESSDMESEPRCDLATEADPENCGGCGLSCFGGECIAGLCAIERIVITTKGEQWTGGTDSPRLSADGRFVVFVSYGVGPDPNGKHGLNGVFVHDRMTDITERISVRSGVLTLEGPAHPAISADGTVIAFASWDSTLVENDTNGIGDVFVYDRNTHETELVSVRLGPMLPRLGSDPAIRFEDITDVDISADGQVAVFATGSSELGDTAELGPQSIYVYDRRSSSIELVSSTTSGAPANEGSHYCSISADGRIIAFQSFATNLIDEVEEPLYGGSFFVRELETGVTSRVGVLNSDGGRPVLSSDGRFVLLPDSGLLAYSGMMIHDRVLGTTERYSDKFDGSFFRASDDLRFVALDYSDARVFDRQTQTLTQLSKSSTGQLGNGYTREVDISADGRFVAFSSSASNLVEGDTNGVSDIFVVGVPQ